MSQIKLSLGQAIDQIVGALESLNSDARKTAIEAACAHLKISLGRVAQAPEPRERTAEAAVSLTASGGGSAAEVAPQAVRVPARGGNSVGRAA